MSIGQELLRKINSAQIMSAAVYPSSPYTGFLPKKTVKRGSKGSDVKATQKFLNWCIKAGLKADGTCGKKTVRAIKRFQKQYRLKVDGVFGPTCRKKASAIVKKYAPKKKKKKVTKPLTWVDKANAWAKKIAADDSYHYVFFNSGAKGHECPICHNHPKGKFHGWNCIGLAYATWHHGGGIKNKCNCGVIDNYAYNRMLRTTTANALAIAKNRLGISQLKVIKNKNGVSKKLWKPGDICIKYSGNTYVHTFYYLGNGKVFDSRSSGTAARQIAIRDWSGYTCKMIIRYTGK